MVSSPTEQEFEWIRSAQAGDREAFRQLAERQADALYCCAHALCRDRHRAEDLAQETLVAAWQSLGRFDGRCRFSTWLYGILRHKYLKSSRRRRPDLVDLDQIGSQALEQRAPPPGKAAEELEDALRVRRAVASLPSDHRSVIELRFFGGASLEEIATLLDCPLGTVKSRLHHGLEKLRKMELSVNLFAAGRESLVRKP